MARIAAVLRALLRAGAREGKTLGSFSGNNLFYVAVALLFMDDPGAFVSLNVILALILFFPLSTDPLRKVPASRLASWPLTGGERRALRVITPWLNPMTWILGILIVMRTVTLGLWTLLAGLFAFSFAIPSIDVPGGQVGFPLPRFPTQLNQLIRNNIRQILTTLDFYCALMLSAGASLFLAFGKLPAEARLPMTLLVVLALSTFAQSLFGLDSAGALTRYRILPVAGWRILAAKDAAFLMINFVLCLPLAPLPALSAAFIGLALGHKASVMQRREQTRWRFTAAASFANGIVQVILMILAASTTSLKSGWVLVVCIALWAISLHRYGRRLP